MSKITFDPMFLDLMCAKAVQCLEGFSGVKIITFVDKDNSEYCEYVIDPDNSLQMRASGKIIVKNKDEQSSSFYYYLIEKNKKFWYNNTRKKEKK